MYLSDNYRINNMDEMHKYLDKALLEAKEKKYADDNTKYPFLLGFVEQMYLELYNAYKELEKTKNKR